METFGFDRVGAFAVDHVDKRIDETLPQAGASQLSTVLLDQFERDVLFEKFA